ncbi:hypothetical protein A3726_34640 [Erythrobacter sp. HI0037]|nr:hypothetical protein A3726_34640 [Erythrobacter sp. HI0037]
MTGTVDATAETRVDTGPVIDGTTDTADRALMTAEERAQAVEDRLDSTTDTTMERADEASDVDADLETDTGAEFDTPAADAEVDVETDAELDTQPER